MENQDKNKELKKLYFKDMTLQKLYNLFGLYKVSKTQEFEDWLGVSEELTDKEVQTATLYQEILIENLEAWNEQDLSMGFIGPILHLIKFTVPYKLNLFAQRYLSGIVGDYELVGRPDGILADGFQEPQTPYFSFLEYKKGTDNSGDPAGQCLAAMLVGQTLNEEDDVIYGCYVVGHNWYFMVLKGKEFAISKDFSATHDDDALDIVRILKGLRSILFKKLGIEENER